MSIFGRNGTVAALALAALVGIGGVSDAFAQSAPKTLRFIPQADLRSIDPIWTTAYVTRNFGYLVFDTLFSLDKDFKPQPQMVDTWTVSDDKLSWKFTLRPGLKWHDGTPVRAADCTASIKRWGARDPFGQKLMEAVDTMAADNDNTFTIKLKAPFPLMLDALGKLSSNVPFMMPERLANTDPFQQIPEAIGSGPFKFVKEEWQPGHQAVFVKNPDYIPRKEPPSLASGGKVAKVDRIEWLYIPDTATAAAALKAGEVDWYEQPSADVLPVFSSDSDIKVDIVDKLGNIGILRFNHLNPPFDNPKMRLAVMNLVNQKDYMAAAAGDEKYWKVCWAIFVCGGTPFETTVSAEAMLKGPDIEKAKSLIKEAGYKGEKIVVLQPTDRPQYNALTMVLIAGLRAAGVNVDVQAGDWSTISIRRAKKDPVDKGGWNLFITTQGGPDVTMPITDAWFNSSCDTGNAGWPCDDTLQALVTRWTREFDRAKRHAMIAGIQARAYESVPYVPIGQFFQPIAFRKNVTGVLASGQPVYWNIDKQ